MKQRQMNRAALENIELEYEIVGAGEPKNLGDARVEHAYKRWVLVKY